MKMCGIDPLELSTISNSTLQDWLFLENSGISETRSNLEIA